MRPNTQEGGNKEENNFHSHFVTWFSTKRNILLMVSKASFLVINNWPNMAGSAPVTRVVGHSGFLVILKITNLTRLTYIKTYVVKEKLYTFFLNSNNSDRNHDFNAYTRVLSLVRNWFYIRFSVFFLFTSFRLFIRYIKMKCYTLSQCETI